MQYSEVNGSQGMGVTVDVGGMEVSVTVSDATSTNVGVDIGNGEGIGDETLPTGFEFGKLHEVSNKTNRIRYFFMALMVPTYN